MEQLAARPTSVAPAAAAVASAASALSTSSHTPPTDPSSFASGLLLAIPAMSLLAVLAVSGCTVIEGARRHHSRQKRSRVQSGHKAATPTAELEPLSPAPVSIEAIEADALMASPPAASLPQVQRSGGGSVAAAEEEVEVGDDKAKRPPAEPAPPTRWRPQRMHPGRAVVSPSLSLLAACSCTS